MTEGERVITAIRRIIRAIDIHSRALMKSHGLTGPQLAILNELSRSGPLTIGEIVRRGSVSQATVTTILDRLEARELVRRERQAPDKRRVIVSLTDAASVILRTNPRLLQDDFIDKFESLSPHRRKQIATVLDTVAEMMDSTGLDSSPFLATGPLTEDVTDRPPIDVP